LANCTEITPFEFDANKQLLGKKNIVPELETRVLPPLASMVTDFVGSKKDDLELSHCENLQKFHPAGLSSEAFVKLIPQLPRSLTEITNTGGLIYNNNDLRALLTQCPLLESYRIIDASWPNDETCGILAAHPGLRRLDLRWTSSVTNAGLKTLLDGNRHLTELRISNNWVNDVTMDILASYPSLRNIDLFHCQNMTNAGLKILLEGNRRLEQLDLHETDWVDDETMGLLAAHPALRHVNLSQCPNITNAGLKTLFERNQQMTLDLQHNTWVNDDTMGLLAARSGLRNMDLRDCPNITNAGLKILLEGNPQLSQLDLQNNDWVNDETLGLLAAHPGLRTVTLNRCEHITNAGIKILLEGNQQLTQLGLQNLECVDNTTMSLLAAHPGLRELDLSYCFNSTNTGLATLLEKNRQLTHLRIDCNGWVNDETLQLLANHPLKEVTLVGCSDVTEEAVDALRKARPDTSIRHW